MALRSPFSAKCECINQIQIVTVYYDKAIIILF